MTTQAKPFYLTTKHLGSVERVENSDCATRDEAETMIASLAEAHDCDESTWSVGVDEIAAFEGLVKTLAEAAQTQLAPGEEWAPASFLDADWSAIVGAAQTLDISLPPTVRNALFEIYCE